MKKILTGSFRCESNTFASHHAVREDFQIAYGEDAASRLYGVSVLRKAGYEIIPMPVAVALPAGSVRQEDYLSMLEEFMSVAREHPDVDGVYIFFHGAMFVEGLGSGEETFVRRLREIIGPDTPISIASDFHSNVSDGLLENINALSGYRTAPHTDYDETEERAANALIRILEGNLSTRMLSYRIPALLADVGQTAKEPYATALRMLADIDALPGVVSASLYNGQPWVDASFVGMSVILSCSDHTQQVNAAGLALQEYLASHLDEFCFDVAALLPDAALEAVPGMAKPVFISDSGDNTTAGADGRSTFLTEKFLHAGLGRFLAAPLCLPEVYQALEGIPDGGEVDVMIPAQDSYSEGFRLKGTLVHRGVILSFINEPIGSGALIRMPHGDLVISEVRASFITEEHFEAMKVDPADYDYVLLKVGYLWPRTVPLAASQLFALTPGVSTNDFSTLDYKALAPGFFYVH